MARIIGVVSGKGGSGKTTVAVNVASGLKLLGKKVMLIDYSFGVRNADIPLNRTDAMLYNINDIFSKASSIDETVVKGEESYMPDFLGGSLDVCLSDHTGLLQRLLKNLSKEYDYIIIDTPSSCGYEFEAVTSCSNVVVAVCTPDAISVSNTALCTGRIGNIDSKEFYLVINNAALTEAENDICAEQIIDEIGASLLGIVRSDKYVAQSLEKGDPIVRYDTFAGKDLEHISRRLCGEYILREKQSFSERLFDKNKLTLKK